MKNYIIVCLYFISGCALAQTETKIKKNSIGIIIIPEWTNLSITGMKTTGKFSYSFGLEFNHVIKPKINFKLGLHYSEKGTKFIDDIISYSSLYLVPQKQVVNLRAIYLDIPIRFDYILNDKKISPFITGGISTNIFLTEIITTKVSYTDGTQIKNKKNGGSIFIYNPINPQLQIGVGINGNLQKYKFQLFPLVKLSLLHVSDGPYLGNKFYSFGFALSLFI